MVIFTNRIIIIIIPLVEYISRHSFLFPSHLSTPSFFFFIMYCTVLSWLDGIHYLILVQQQQPPPAQALP